MQGFGGATRGWIPQPKQRREQDPRRTEQLTKEDGVSFGLWKGQEQANGSSCMVSWRKVQQYRMVVLVFTIWKGWGGLYAYDGS
ncbi:hypothetical protein U9M48_009178, partial [Paspalum notatum var. saurae]